MRVDTALLCDAATVRDGLLHILGGGVTQAGRTEYPAELGLTLALRIMLHPTELEHPHRLEILLQDEDGDKVTKVDAQFGVADPDLVPAGEEAAVVLPWAFPGRPVLPHPGRYSFELLIDGVHQRSVPLNAVVADTQGGEA